MKKNGLIGLVLAMAVMGGCAESNVSGDVQENGEGTAVSAIAEDEIMSLAESMASDMAENESVGQTATARETEETKVGLYEHTYSRRSEEESKTVTIESDVFPYDCEEMIIRVDAELSHYNNVEPYDCIDLANLKKYPDLKKLNLNGNIYEPSAVKLINGDAAASLEKLSQIKLSSLSWEGDWLSGIGSLRVLTVGQISEYHGENLEKLTQVEELVLFRCGICDLSFINGMSLLTDLTLEQCRFYDGGFDGVEDNYSVKKLTINESIGDWILLDNGEYDHKYLTDITGVCKFKGLEYLEVCEANLVNLDRQEKYVRENLPECEASIYK